MVERAAPAARALRRAGFAARGLRPRERAVVRLAARATELTERQAEAVLGDPPAPPPGGDAVAGAIGALPAAVRRRVLRLPGSFESFDQHPEDWRALARAFAARGEDRAQGLTVVGLRTSGTYLAPLVGVALREEGFATVRVCTVRPGHPLRREERAVVHGARRVL